MARPKEFDEEAILDKSIQIFIEKGYNGTSIEDLVNGLNVSRSSLYATYTDKHQLFIKALQRYRQLNTAQLLDLLQNTPKVKCAIQTLFQTIAAEIDNKNMPKGCFVLNATLELSEQDPEIALIGCQNRETVEQAFLVAMQRGQAQGEVSTKHSAEALAGFLFNTFNGLKSIVKTNASKAKVESIIEVALSVLD